MTDSFTEQLQKISPGSLVVLGVPYDAQSSYLPGCAQAPDLIVEAYHSPSSNYYTELGYQLEDDMAISFLGNLPISDYFDIEKGIAQVLQAGGRTFSLGGDHSITYPIMKAQAKKYDKLCILQLDAHGDLYQDFEGNPYSHACPFARIMEDGLVDRLVQVGNRTLSKHQREQAKRFGVEIIEMKDWKVGQEIPLSGPLYVSLDLDVLDPAFAPGISHYEPGGMSPRDVISIIHQIEVPIIGADIVEYNPTRDLNGMTAMVAARFMKEIIGKILS
ncbi:MAG: agmatinase [Saprospiraceae bacterium]|nr:agmatinase [Saprospiraceae bacterium]